METMQHKSDFGAVLRSLRKHNDLSLDVLADKMKERGYKITGANIGGWERGEHSPRTNEALDLLDEILSAHGSLHMALGRTPPGSQAVGPSPAGGGPDASRLDDIEYRLRKVEAWMEGEKARQGWTDATTDYGLAAASGTDQLDEDPADLLEKSTSTRRRK